MAEPTELSLPLTGALQSLLTARLMRAHGSLGIGPNMQPLHTRFESRTSFPPRTVLAPWRVARQELATTKYEDAPRSHPLSSRGLQGDGSRAGGGGATGEGSQL